MTTPTVDDLDVMRQELIRSDADRRRAEERCQRLQDARLQQQRVETALRIQLDAAVEDRRAAHATTRIALEQIDALRSMWAHAQVQMEDQRKAAESLRHRIADVEAECAAASTAAASAAAERLRLEADRDIAETRLHALLTSRSWKLTSPVRRAATLARKVRSALHSR